MAWLTEVASGGHAGYMAAAFGVSFVLLGAELLLLRRRYRAARCDRP